MILADIIDQVQDETEIISNTSVNSSFSKLLPNLQLAWDSTSLGALKTCPRYYYYSIICGLVTREESVHLTFGLIFHAALELYDRERASGSDHESALLRAVRLTIVHTWNEKLKRPWTSDVPEKTRETLIRAIVWYLDQFEDDPLETIIKANGQPAVEESFRFDISDLTQEGFYSLTTGESFLLCGHLDKLVNFQGGVWIVDRKTTKGQIGSDYFQTYSPHNQMSLYSIAGNVVLPDKSVKGLIIDAGQTLVTFTRFQRGIVNRTQSQNNEWLEETMDWLRMAESFARTQRWPRNDHACNSFSSYDGEHDIWKHSGCPYRPVCGSSPEIRPKLLESMYVKRIWDPLQTREA